MLFAAAIVASEMHKHSSQRLSNKERGLSAMNTYSQYVQQEGLQDADERLRVVVDASPMITILFGSDNKVAYCNRTAYEFFGFDSREDLFAGFVEYVNEHTPEFLNDNTPSTSISDRLKAIVTEERMRFVTELVLEGRLRFYFVEMVKLPFGSSYAVAIYISDITEARERESELIKAHRQNELQLTKLNLAMKATKLVLWEMSVDPDDPDPVNDNRMVQWSDEFRSMFGFRDESDFPNLAGSFNNLLHPDDWSVSVNQLNRHLLDKTGLTPYDIEVRLRNKEGEYSYFRATGETIRNDDGAPIHVAGALMDVSETKNLIEEADSQRRVAEAANKAKSSFLNTMSHEIRTPMNAIIGIAEIQLQDEELPSKTREALEKIYTAGDILLSIINDILDFSKIEAGKFELQVDNYETASMISDVAQLNTMHIGSKPIEFVLDIDEKLPSVLTGDSLRIKQILNNILSNAFKYSKEGMVKMTVTSRLMPNCADEVMLILSISDTGQGMTQEQISKLFDEYARFNRDANRATQGTGLGMSITQKLVSMMQGEIFVESEVNLGSTFTVHIPQKIVGSATLGSELARNLQQFQTSSFNQMKRVKILREPMPYGKVLIVDDVETNIFVATGLLSPYMLTIESAESGFQTIERIKQGHQYDIIFMDHMMPDMDGIEATQIIRDMGYDLPIVALTANAVSGQAELFLANGFDDFVSKPIDIRQLNTVLNHLIRDKQTPEVLAEARALANVDKTAGVGDQSVVDAASGIDKQPVVLGAAPSASVTPSVSPQLAEVFVRDSRRSLAAIEAIAQNADSWKDDNLQTVVIHTHSMKSALANVGEAELSKLAYELETAGRENNLHIIEAKLSDFLLQLKHFTAGLEQQVAASESIETAEEHAHLTEQLLLIKAACDAYDIARAERLLTELRNAPWSNTTQQMLAALAERLLHSEFEDASEDILSFVF